MRVVVDPTKCRGSGRCIEACPEKAIVLAEGKAVIDQTICNRDGICVPACPNDAIRIEEGEEERRP